MRKLAVLSLVVGAVLLAGPSKVRAGGYEGGCCQPDAAPEMDPGSMAGALTLLASGVLVATDRFRRKQTVS